SYGKAGGGGASFTTGTGSGARSGIPAFSCAFSNNRFGNCMTLARGSALGIFEVRVSCVVVPIDWSGFEVAIAVQQRQKARQAAIRTICESSLDGRASDRRASYPQEREDARWDSEGGKITRAEPPARRRR